LVRGVYAASSSVGSMTKDYPTPPPIPISKRPKGRDPGGGIRMSQSGHPGLESA